MAITKSGAVRTTLIQKRRVMSVSSGLTSSSAVTRRGSRAIPQMGQLPGASRTISGCIGQVHSVLGRGAAGKAGSSAMPHFGQAPGFEDCTSGSIGQIHRSAATAGRGAASPSHDSGLASNRSLHDGLQKKYSRPLYTLFPAAVAGSTTILHTGSIVVIVHISRRVRSA